MTVSSDPYFPVLALDEQSVAFIERPADLGRVSKYAERTGHLRRVVFVDGAGSIFRVGGYRKRPTGILEFLGRVLELEVDLRAEGRMELGDLKDRVLVSLDECREIWEASGDFEALRAAVVGASTPLDVVRAFGR